MSEYVEKTLEEIEAEVNRRGGDSSMYAETYMEVVADTLYRIAIRQRDELKALKGGE